MLTPVKNVSWGELDHSPASCLDALSAVDVVEEAPPVGAVSVAVILQYELELWEDQIGLCDPTPGIVPHDSIDKGLRETCIDHQHAC